MTSHYGPRESGDIMLWSLGALFVDPRAPVFYATMQNAFLVCFSNPRCNCCPFVKIPLTMNSSFCVFSKMYFSKMFQILCEVKKGVVRTSQIPFFFFDFSMFYFFLKFDNYLLCVAYIHYLKSVILLLIQIFLYGSCGQT